MFLIESNVNTLSLKKVQMAWCGIFSKSPYFSFCVVKRSSCVQSLCVPFCNWLYKYNKGADEARNPIWCRWLAYLPLTQDTRVRVPVSEIFHFKPPIFMEQPIKIFLHFQISTLYYWYKNLKMKTDNQLLKYFLFSWPSMTNPAVLISEYLKNKDTYFQLILQYKGGCIALSIL